MVIFFGSKTINNLFELQRLNHASERCKLVSLQHTCSNFLGVLGLFRKAYICEVELAAGIHCDELHHICVLTVDICDCEAFI